MNQKKNKLSPTSTRRKEIINIRAQINEMENKKAIGKVNSCFFFLRKINNLTNQEERKLKYLKL